MSVTPLAILLVLILILIFIAILPVLPVQTREGFQEQDNTNGVVIVTSHYNEDLSWLTQSGQEHVVCSKTIKSPQCQCEKNKGKEASAYLKFIIDNYSTLPQHIAFIHGHEDAWHQQYVDMLNTIRCAKYTEYDFISLNGNWIDDRTMKNGHIQYLQQLWPMYFQPFLNRPAPTYVLHDCCAQFIVSKKCIHRLPKEAYELWYKLIMDDSTSDGIAVTFEYIWHIIFGDNDVVSEKEHRTRFRENCLKEAL